MKGLTTALPFEELSNENYAVRRRPVSDAFIQISLLKRTGIQVVLIGRESVFFFYEALHMNFI